MAILSKHSFETGLFFYPSEGIFSEGDDIFYSDRQVGAENYGLPGEGPEQTDHIAVTDEYSFIGDNSLKVTLEKPYYRDENQILARSELRSQIYKGWTGSPGIQDGCFSFSWMTPQSPSSEGTSVIAQLVDGGSPSMSLRWDYETNLLFFRLHNNVSNTDHDIVIADALEWYHIDFWYQAREDSSGIIKIRLNGTVINTIEGQNIFSPQKDLETPYWKVGQYNGDFGEEYNDIKICYFDAIVYSDGSDNEADTFAAIDTFREVNENDGNTYVSNSGNDSNPGTELSPVATVSHAYSLVEEGGTIFGKRGDIWYETILLNKSGTLENPILFDAYGNTELPLPKMTGFRTLSSWTDIGGGLYRCTDAEITDRVNCLIVDDVVQPLGRLPKTSYYAATARTGDATGSITDTVNLDGSEALGGSEIVIRKNAWVLDRGIVTSQSGTTLNYNGTSSYTSKVGYGYFLQNKRSLCTELHDWCREGSDIIMYFGAEDPGDYVIKVSVLVKIIKSGSDASIDVLNRRHVHWNNWRFEGYNGDMDDTDYNNGSVINLQGCDGLKWHHCEFQFIGNTLARWYDCPGLEFKWCDISDCMNMGLYSPFQDGSTGLDLSFNTFNRIGIIPGAGGNSDNGYSCIKVSQETLQIVIEGNRIEYCGYNGIFIGGFDFLLRKNYIRYACYLMDDGGCIYTFKGSRNHVYSRLTRIIEFNICLDSVGNNDGKPSGTLAGEGIYIDDNASTETGDELTIRFNISSGSKLGLKLHNCRDITVTDNLFYDNLQQVEFASDTITNTNIRNIEFKRNVMYSPDATQECLAMQCKDNSPQLYGDFDYNYYMRPSNENDLILVNFKGSPTSTETYSLAEWKASGLNHDENSKGTPTASQLYLPVLNDTLESAIIFLDRIYIDKDGNLVDTGEITLQSFEGVLLLDDLGPVDEPTANSKPTAVINSPLTGSVFYTDEVIDFVTFADDPDVGDSVVQLDLYYGPLPIEKRTNPPQGENLFSWASPVAGEHLIMLISTDSFGAMKSDTIDITILVPNENPVSIISSSVDSGEAPLEVTFTGDGSTDDVAVVSYLWDFDDTTTSTETNPVHIFEAGNYNVSLTVTDGDGLTDTSYHLITVTVPNTLPTVEITNPSNGSSFLEGSTILLAVTVGDVDNDITHVDYRISDISIGESDIAPYSIDWENVSVGVYSVIARAYDSEGYTDSDPVEITVFKESVNPNPSESFKVNIKIRLV